MKQEFELIIHYDRIGGSDMYNAHTVGKLVRCKDCECHGTCRYEQHLGLDGYCSKGERKDEVLTYTINAGEV